MNDSRANSSKLLHLATNAQLESEVNAQSPDVGSRLAVHPEDSQLVFRVILDQLALVNVPDSELPLDGGNQRGSLVAGASERF